MIEIQQNSAAAFQTVYAGADKGECYQGNESRQNVVARGNAFAENGFFRFIGVEIDGDGAALHGLLIHAVCEAETGFRHGVSLSLVSYFDAGLIEKLFT